MKKSIAMKWADYLEQKGLKQAVGVLDDGDGGKCCLGHLCDMLGVKRRVTMLYDAPVVVYGKKNDNSRRILPSYVMYRTGIRTNRGDLKGEPRCLAELNDNGVPLKKIAGIIREKWEKL